MHMHACTSIKVEFLHNLFENIAILFSIKWIYKIIKELTKRKKFYTIIKEIAHSA